MSSKVLTYLDTGVVLAVVRGEPGASLRAYAILNDPAREFVGSEMLRLELLPNAIYFQRQIEQQFCEAYLKQTTIWVKPSQKLFASAFTLACDHGISALDALHIAAAVSAGAVELITTEKPSKPIYRASIIKITSL